MVTRIEKKRFIAFPWLFSNQDGNICQLLWRR